jgi:uncharacterized membrane protein YedE/YeeE
MDYLIDRFGEDALMLALGLCVGVLFGMAAYRSRFCLRAATVELAGGQVGSKLAIWLVAFTTALVSVQAAVWAEVLNVDTARQIAATGSLSGAIIGGLLFGVGMVLARGCASRLLVLSATGNLRAIVTGLVLTLTAQASLRGVLAPARESLSALWTIDGGGARRLIEPDTLLHPVMIVAAAMVLLASFVIGRRHGLGLVELVSAMVVGLAVYLGWQGTYMIASTSFEIVPVQSVTFTGPSTDTLMALVNERSLPVGFGVGLVPGVFLGAMGAALFRRDFRIQRFEPGVPMERYLVGAVLMGFGSMLAGGCAVGAGMSGGAILALTAWVAVFCMWVGAMTTHWLMSLQAQPRLV